MPLRTMNRLLGKGSDAGLLILRVGIGVMFMIHGWPKLSGGPEVWVKLGGAIGVFGITFAPTFWGLMAAVSEFAGGLLLALGLLTRPACVFLLSTMVVAAAMHITKGDGFTVYSHAMKAGVVFLSLIFVGPGRFSLDQRFGFLR